MVSNMLKFTTSGSAVTEGSHDSQCNLSTTTWLYDLWQTETDCQTQGTAYTILAYSHMVKPPNILIHPFNGPFPGIPGWAGTRKVKPIWILLKRETVSGSGISWAICKSAPHSRRITTPAPHHSVFFTGRMPFLPPNQQRQSTEGT